MTASFHLVGPGSRGFTDDLVGCDTLLSLGYCYNAGNDDELYGRHASGGRLRLLPGSDGRESWGYGPRIRRGVPDYRNLSMSSFNKYVNGTDPHSAIQSSI
jgi:hypothetical protein